MEFTAAEIAKLLKGEVKGNPDVKVSKLAKIEEGGEGTISFLSNKKYEPYLYTTSSPVVVVSRAFLLEKEVNTTLILVDDAYQSFILLLKHYNEVKNSKIGIESPVVVSDTAVLGENIYLGSFAYIGENVEIADGVKIYPHVYIGNNSKIGRDTILYSGAKLYSETEVGANCVIHANVVLGSDGFGFAPKEDGTYEKIPQIGNVIIEDNVEIGVGTTIDRATMGSTIIRKGVKIDNLVQIAHNVQIGENTVIASQSGIAGSTKVGKNAMIGGQAGIVGHINIGNQVQIQAQSGVNHDIADGGKVYGSPAMIAGDYRRAYVYFKKLPNIVKRIEELESNNKNK